MSSIMTKLPNNIIMNIIRMADGGLNTHKTNMKSIFEQVIGKRPVHWFEDGCVPPNLCPMFLYEGGYLRDTEYWDTLIGNYGENPDSESEEEDDDSDDDW